MDVSKEITDLLEEVEFAKEEMANAQGQMKVIRSNIQEEAGTDSIKKAEESVITWEKEAEKADLAVEEILKTLKKDYDW